MWRSDHSTMNTFQAFQEMIAQRLSQVYTSTIHMKSKLSLCMYIHILCSIMTVDLIKNFGHYVFCMLAIVSCIQGLSRDMLTLMHAGLACDACVSCTE